MVIFLAPETPQEENDFVMHHFSFHYLLRAWTHYGIDALSLIGFLFGALAVLASSPLVKLIILKQVDLTLGRLPRGDQTDDQRAQEEDRFHSRFDWERAGLIGVLERLFYVYAVLENAWPLIAGWLAMKAFFVRLVEPTDAEKVDASSRQAIYHVYLFGNMVSVLTGLVCGHIAKLMCPLLWKVF